MAFLGGTSHFYGGGQVGNPANVLTHISGIPPATYKAPIGTVSIDFHAKAAWMLVSDASGSGVWQSITGGSAGRVDTLTGNTGGPVVPAGGNITVVGNATQGISSSGSTSTLTITASDATTTQKGVSELSTGAESIAGVATDKSVTPDSLKSKLGSQILHGLAYGSGTGASVSWLVEASDGEIPIGVTGAAPTLATITSGAGIAIANAPGSITISASGGVAGLYTADSGTAAPISGNLNVLGTSAQGISTSGTSNNLTITASDATTTQKGVLSLATNAEAITGTDTTKAITSDDLKAKLGTQISHGIPYGAGTTGAVAWLAEPANGQLVIGSTGSPPVVASLTAGPGITITPGAGSITIGSSAGSGLTWTSVAGTTQTVVNNTGYVPMNAALTTFTLPLTAAFGSSFAIAGYGTGGWTLAQNSSQQLILGAISTTTGLLGSISSQNQNDCIEFLCIVANTTWIARSAWANLTIV